MSLRKILTFAFIAVIGFSDAQYQLSDPDATPETVKLYENLVKAQKKGYFVGHQDDLAYGVYWKYQDGRSDVKEVVKDFPAVYGWELGDLELGHDKNLDGVPFDKMKEFIKEGHQRGGIITLSWHPNNPVTGKNAWDPSNKSISEILPNGSKHELFKTYLDKVSDFLTDLKDKNGKPIPVLWRPWHEHTGTWFWWGVNSASDEEYKAFFKFTLDYLRKTKNLHNLISVYNTGTEFNSPEEYLKRYPGDDYVDMFSFDAYQRSSVEEGYKFAEQIDGLLKNMNLAGVQHKKSQQLERLATTKFPTISGLPKF
ncbi:glycoside hydrolase family 26 protein [Chryseobacterium taklimakanense]|uniref:Beta-mannosidase n=1 Tax=Chryseobacterium taklimakanense TaxID=536441 RepID=A0A3G8WII2_9FLAO|nr:glycosyl hydrolase [Chryseobacterium taklimakanense]AZI20323.1 beta-mannosidase [Chryseobacterium taklimakanense]